MPEKSRSHSLQTIRRDLPDMIFGSALAFCLYLGFLLTLTSMFGLSYHGWLVILVGVVVILAVNAFWKQKGVIYGLLFVITAFFLIGFAAGSRFSLNGLFVLLNQAIDTIGTKTPHIFTKLSTDIAQQNVMFYGTFFMTLFSALCACLCSVIIRSGQRTLLAVFGLVPLILSLLLDVTPGKGAAVLLAAALLFAAAKFGTASKKLQVQLVNVVFMAVLMIPVAGLSLLMASSDQVQPVFYSVLTRLRYEKSPVDSYPEGQLAELKKIEKKEEPALYVTMERPQPMYLKGFVGSSFDDQNWQELPNSVNYENASLFYWLHEEGFYGNSQLSYLSRLYDTGTGASSDAAEVQVENVHGDSRYVYLPYEVTDPETFSLVKNCDATAVSSGFFGVRDYTFHVCEPVWNDLVAMDANLFELQNRQVEEANAYISQESFYNTFVYQNFTSLSANQREVLDRLLKKPAATGNSHIDYRQAKLLISQFLSETLTYDENASYGAKDEDFLRSLLMEEKKGSDIHYATVAALIYRYLGIPARYAEGYTVTAEDAAQMEAGQRFAVNGTRAHAWVEVYQDTIGWVPVEFAPGYEEKMGLTNDSAVEAPAAENAVPQTAAEAPAAENAVPQTATEAPAAENVVPQTAAEGDTENSTAQP